MRKSVKLSSSIAVAAFALLAGSKSAWALGPVSIEIGAKGGIGTNPADSPVPNPLGFGLGGRGGVEIMNVYVGANVLYYFGASNSAIGVDLSSHTLFYGLEAGYGFKLLDDIITIRPQLGIGNSSFTVSGSVNGTSVGDSSASHLYLEPGVNLIVGLAGWFVGADANYLVIPGVDQVGGDSKTYSAFTLHGQIGFKL